VEGAPEMKDKILKEIMDWIDKEEDKDVFIEEFIDQVINKTADALLDEVKDEFKDEFEKGNLQHPFIISPEYYLYLKLKEIKYKCVGKTEDDLPEKFESKEQTTD